MLSRYQMRRVPRDPNDPLPDGIRKSTLKQTKHCLAPTADLVFSYLENPSLDAWKIYEVKYYELLETRFKTRRSEFYDLAELAMKQNVFLGCYCPTVKNPDVNHCHTVLALKFMKIKFPGLTIKLPK